MKPIRLTAEFISQIRDEIMAQISEKLNIDTVRKDAEESLSKLRMSDGSFKFLREFKYEKNFKYEKSDRRATIRISPVAYAKMMTVIMSQPDEVGWHGTTERLGQNEFLIKDIFVYPQQVTSATVDTDEEEYAKWLISLDDIDENIFPNLHFHGHSHVNMGVSPSGVDMGHRETIVSQLRSEDYYIFMIWNKKLEWSAAVYDMNTNTLFETPEIDVVVELGDITAGTLIKDLEEKVTKVVWNYHGNQNGGNYYGSGYQTGAHGGGSYPGSSYDYGKKNGSQVTGATTPALTNPATGNPLVPAKAESGKTKKEENGIGNDPDDFRKNGWGSGWDRDWYD